MTRYIMAPAAATASTASNTIESTTYKGTPVWGSR